MNLTEEIDLEAFAKAFLEAYLENGYMRWSRKFGPAFKVDRMLRVMIRNEETKEPFARV